MKDKVRNYICYVTLAYLYSYKVDNKPLKVKINNLKNNVKEAVIDYHGNIYKGVSEIAFYALDFACFKFVDNLVRVGRVLRFKKEDGLNQKLNKKEIHTAFFNLWNSYYMIEPVYIYTEDNDCNYIGIKGVNSVPMNLEDYCDLEIICKDKKSNDDELEYQYLSYLCVYLNSYFEHNNSNFKEWFNENNFKKEGF